MNVDYVLELLKEKRRIIISEYSEEKNWGKYIDGKVFICDYAISILNSKISDQFKILKHDISKIIKNYNQEIDEIIESSKYYNVFDNYEEINIAFSNRLYAQGVIDESKNINKLLKGE